MMSPKKYFRVEGWTSSKILVVRFGNDIKAVPSKNYSSYTERKGKLKFWVKDLLNSEIEGYEDKVTSLNHCERESIDEVYKVRAFEKNKANENKINKYLNLNTPLPFIRLTLFFILVISFYKYLVSLNILKNRFQARLYVFLLFKGILMIIMTPFIYTLEINWSIFFRNRVFTTLPTLFFAYLLVFLLFELFSKKLPSESFAQNENYKTGLLLILCFSCEFLIKSVVNDIFANHNYSMSSGMLYSDFFITPFSFAVIVIFVLANFLSNLIQHIYSLLRKARQLDQVVSESTKSSFMLQTAQTHINTHFLFNSLDALAAIAPSEPEKTEKMAVSLAAYYRYCTNREEKTWVSIEDEVAALNAYMDVEKIRFGDKLTFEIILPENLAKGNIPKFLLQPLVENAVKYGYNLAKSAITIKIVFSKPSDFLIIRIYDSGIPFSDDIIPGKVIAQVTNLLKELYLDKYSLTFVNEPQKHVEITIKT